MGLGIIVLSGIFAALFSLGYKIRKQFDLSIQQLVFFFSLFVVVFSTIFLLLLQQPFYTRQALIIGPPMGLTSAIAIYLYHRVIDTAKHNISWTAIQFSILIPFFTSIVFYDEQLSLQGIIGVVLVFLSIILFGIRDKSSVEQAIPSLFTGIILFLASFLSGVNQTLAKIFTSSFGGENQFTLHLYAGLTMTVVTAIILLAKREPLPGGKKRWGAILAGGYMGTLGPVNMVLLIIGLKTVPGSLAYPVRNALNIILVFVFSYFLYKETATKTELIGVGTALAGLIILSASLV